MATVTSAVEGGMIMFYKLLAVGGIGFILLTLYSCLVVASDADDQTEKRLKDLDNDD